MTSGTAFGGSPLKMYSTAPAGVGRAALRPCPSRPLPLSLGSAAPVAAPSPSPGGPPFPPFRAPPYDAVTQAPSASRFCFGREAFTSRSRARATAVPAEPTEALLTTVSPRTIVPNVAPATSDTSLCLCPQK